MEDDRQNLEKAIVEPKFQRNLWFTDKDDDQAFSLRHTGKILFKEASPYQLVRVLESPSHGKFLALNNMVMCTERDEHHYHEMIVHPAMQVHPNPKKILVIGGGDGGTVRELFKYPVEKVTMVEIDDAVVRATKQHLPTLSCEFGNPKLDLKIEDGIEFVKNALPDSFDVIIVDGSDPVGPAEGLFTEAFYQDCRRALRSEGILITQGESPLFHEKAFAELNQCLKKIFGRTQTHTLLFFAPTYPTGMWSHQIAVKGDRNPATDFNEARARSFTKEFRLRYYNVDVHKAAFAMPGFVREMLGESQDA
jgi:spermidine synthase